MPSLPDLQRSFLHFLQSQSEEVASYIIGDETLDVATRLQIYRNAYSTRLKKTIETDHPQLGKYLGEDLFELMVSGYIARCPSENASLRDFGASLPDYLAVTQPFTDSPILAEIALFERQLLGAFDAADACCACVEDLQSIEPEKWPQMRVQLHPSVSLFSADWNSVESWQALKEDEAPPQAEVGPERHWVLWRGDDRLTQFHALSVEGKSMLYSLLQGDTFAEICEQLQEIVPADQVSAIAVEHLLQWLEAGIVSRLRTGAMVQPDETS